jgi:hypothetical protein
MSTAARIQRTNIEHSVQVIVLSLRNARLFEKSENCCVAQGRFVDLNQRTMSQLL